MLLIFRSAQEIAELLAHRAKTLRVAQNVPQAELAERAGISAGTLRRFEAGSTISLENFVRILDALGRVEDLEKVLVREPTLSIQQREQLEAGSHRLRARRKTV